MSDKSLKMAEQSQLWSDKLFTHILAVVSRSVDDISFISPNIVKKKGSSNAYEHVQKALLS